MIKYMITGGVGFIGSCLVRRLAESRNNKICIIDNLSYSSNLSNLSNLLKKKNCVLKKIDISNFKKTLNCIKLFKPNYIFHLAAESHVDRSIENNFPFIKTNILGTHSILEATRFYYSNLTKIKKKKFKFIHISTDEVFGDLRNKKNLFKETDRFNPSSPYSASKASSDHLVNAWCKTYKIPLMISNCTNNFGPYQHPEKLIPHMIISALLGNNLPIYGNGLQVRDWIFVDDHVDALLKISKKGRIGETYNVGGKNQIKNITIVKKICNYLDLYFKRTKANSFLKQISYVKDRPAHDTRYAVNINKIRKDIKWKPSAEFNNLLKKTIKWYLENPDWWKKILKKNYKLERIGLKND
jgi:dTDP-glucose 4,6-dehydratase